MDDKRVMDEVPIVVSDGEEITEATIVELTDGLEAGEVPSDEQ